MQETRAGGPNSQTRRLPGAALLLGAILALAPARASAELRGHGGPVRALAVAQDGRLAISGSFDGSAIVWALDRGEALQVLRFHDGAVNAVAALPDGGFVTGGEEGRVAVWRHPGTMPARVLDSSGAAVAALALSPDAGRIAAAGWDGGIRIFDLRSGETRVLSGHQGPVAAVAFTASGEGLVSAGHDATLRLWRLERAGELASIVSPTPLSALAVAADGRIATGGADGAVRILSADGQLLREGEALGAPITALALSPDGARIAAATIRGSVAILDAQTLRAGPFLGRAGSPVWSLAFAPGRAELLTGGGDGVVRRLNLAPGANAVTAASPTAPSLVDPLARFGGDPGAEVFRACVACHALTPDEGNRAGPTLHGVFGRRIASAPGYMYSEALRRLPIVWTAETINDLFEIGPSRYTPGTKMPEQTIGAADRQALVRFLERATAP